MKNLFAVAGQDIKAVGAPNQIWDGIIAAGEQIEVGGAASLQGILMAGGKPTVSKLVKDNKLHGTVTMTCGANMVTPFVVPGGFRVVAWRSVYN